MAGERNHLGLNNQKRLNPLALFGRVASVPPRRLQMTTVHTLEPMLRKLKLWVHLDDRQQQALLSLPHSVVKMEKQKTFVREGDPVENCWLVLSGHCVRFKYVGSGGRQIVSIHMIGDLVDMQNAMLGVADHSVATLAACKMAKIPIEPLRNLSDADPAIKDAFWFDTLVDASIFREWVANVGRRDAVTRIAHLFCEIGLKMDAVGLNGQDYEFPMTQDQLADATGLTAVHVNRVLQSMTEQKLIERITPRSIVIGDWKRLAATGDFRPDYLHLDAMKRKHRYR